MMETAMNLFIGGLLAAMLGFFFGAFMGLDPMEDFVSKAMGCLILLVFFGGICVMVVGGAMLLLLHFNVLI